MADVSIFETVLSTDLGPHAVVARALEAGNHLPPIGDGRCLTFYAYEAAGGWEGKYPGREQNIILRATYNPHLSSDTETLAAESLAEFKRVVAAMNIKQAFVPCYETRAKVHKFASP